MFGRAAMTLGIGPHSSSFFVVAANCHGGSEPLLKLNCLTTYNGNNDSVKAVCLF